MHKKISATAAILIGLLGLAQAASAQDDSGKFRPFNGLFANMFDNGPGPQPVQRNQTSDSDVQYYSNADVPTPHAPTRVQPPAQPPAPPVADPPADPPGVDNGATAAPSTALQRRAATNDNYSFQWNDGSVPPPPAQNPAETSGPAITHNGAQAGMTSGVPAGGSRGDGMPLHERLKQYRQSPFGNTANASSSVPQELPKDGPALNASAGDPRPAPASGYPPGTPGTLPPPPPSDAPRPASGYPTPPAMAQSQPAAAEPQQLSAAKPPTDAAPEPSVLIDHKSPQLSVETIGPRKIVMGKEAAYEVVLQNSGEQAAEEVAVTVGLPDWAEVAGTSASTGDVSADHETMVPAADHSVPCRWVLRRIEAHAKEKLSLKIIPRQSKPFELAVHWDFKQAPSQAMIEVQEPKLTMRLDGPREVLYGKKELYKLKLDNSGNGPAENVTLTLMPLSASDTSPVTHRLGTIPAGDERSIDVELTARQSGKIAIRVEANADAGAHAALAEDVLVHRGGLQVQLDGPSMQFVGTPATYRLVVSNPGDAVSKNVKLTAKLPTGMRFVSGSDGATAESTPEGSRVHWSLERFEPGERRALEMKCSLAVSGPNRLEITAAADDDLVAATEAVTRVEAVADLRLEIKEPDGPVALGSEAVYELHVRNRGTKAAENVEVMSYFSNGVEPVAAEGHANHISPGQVVFDVIPVIGPASEMVLTVKAKAQVAGNHVFRAEVRCKAAGTRLVREEMTHYYQDGLGQQEIVGNRADAAPDGQRTAERQSPLPLPPDQPEPTRAIKR